MAQLVERLFPTLQIRGSNQVISKYYVKLSSALKKESKENELAPCLN